jgi:hypothetical protein
MKQIISSRANRFRLIPTIFAATLGLAALAAVAAPASAREWDHGRDGRGHEWRHDEGWRWHRPAFFGAFAPAPVYVPEPVYAPEPSYYYPPAPVYVPPVASFNLVVPLRIH